MGAGTVLIMEVIATEHAYHTPDEGTDKDDNEEEPPEVRMDALYAHITQYTLNSDAQQHMFTACSLQIKAFREVETRLADAKKREDEARAKVEEEEAKRYPVDPDDENVAMLEAITGQSTEEVIAALSRFTQLLFFFFAYVTHLTNFVTRRLANRFSPDVHGADGEGRLQFALGRLLGDEEVENTGPRFKLAKTWKDYKQKRQSVEQEFNSAKAAMDACLAKAAAAADEKQEESAGSPAASDERMPRPFTCGPAQVWTGIKAKQLAVMSSGLVAVSNDGRLHLWTWGEDAPVPHPAEARLSMCAASHIDHIATCHTFGVAVLADGSVAMWADESLSHDCAALQGALIERMPHKLVVTNGGLEDGEVRPQLVRVAASSQLMSVAQFSDNSLYVMGMRPPSWRKLVGTSKLRAQQAAEEAVSGTASKPKVCIHSNTVSGGIELSEDESGVLLRGE